MQKVYIIFLFLKKIKIYCKTGTFIIAKAKNIDDIIENKQYKNNEKNNKK
jgi:hypothetical protein